MHQQISIISIHIYCTYLGMGRAQLKTQKLDNDNNNPLSQWTGNFSAQPERFYINDQRISKKPCIYSSSWLAKIFSLIFLAGIRSQGSQRHFHRSEKFPARPMPKLYIDFYLWLDFWPMKTYIVLLQKKNIIYAFSCL